jgi:hypothetical protein
MNQGKKYGMNLDVRYSIGKSFDNEQKNLKDAMEFGTKNLLNQKMPLQHYKNSI